MKKASAQLKKEIDSADIKIIGKLFNLKPLHASWIVDLYKHLSDKQEKIVTGFDSAGISEAVTIKHLRFWVRLKTLQRV